METLHPRCAGLDVHKDEVAACLRVTAGRKADHTHRRFPTTTRGLLALRDWLAAANCPIAALEATGVYWKPVWHILEGTVALVLANPHHVRAVPGRKSDTNDAAWLADLLAHGLIRASFVPPAPIQALRDLTRTRKQLSRAIARHTLRIQKTLEDANLKLTGLLTDLLGTSGRAILEGLIAGETDPQRLAALTTGRLQATSEQLQDALRGCVRPHHQVLLQIHLDQIDALQKALGTLDGQIEGLLAPFRVTRDHLRTIPGVGPLVAATILAEIGADMTRFPTPSHLISWAGLCPRLDETAGKRRTTRLRHGAPWLKTALVQSAWAAVRSKDTYARAQYLRLKARRGARKAAVAVAASLLTAAYFIIRDGVDYHDLGGGYFDTQDRTKVAHRLTRRLEALGFRVQLVAA